MGKGLLTAVDLDVPAGLAYLMVALLAVPPLFPIEAVVVSGGALAAAGELEVIWVVVAAAWGVLCGDVLIYRLGRGFAHRGVERLARHRRGRFVLAWAAPLLDRHAGPMLVAFRFVPGGRAAAALAAGLLRLPARQFAGYAAIGAVLLASYLAMLGYVIAGSAPNPLLGLMLALAVAGTVMAVTSLIPRIARRLTSQYVSSAPEETGP